MAVFEIKSVKPMVDPDHVLEKAKGNYDALVIVGYDKAGNLDVRSTSSLNAAQIVFMMAQFQHALLSGDYYDEE